MWCLREEISWLKEHAKWDEATKKQVCKESNQAIMGVRVGRSIHSDLFARVGVGAGSGEVRYVMHWFCPSHGQEPNIRHGLPVVEGELIEIG